MLSYLELLFDAAAAFNSFVNKVNRTYYQMYGLTKCTIFCPTKNIITF